MSRPAWALPRVAQEAHDRGAHGLKGDAPRAVASPQARAPRTEAEDVPAPQPQPLGHEILHLATSTNFSDLGYLAVN